jgi:hypothetical protein
MLTKFIVITVLLFTFSINKPSFALGKLGHQVVCQLAFEHLSQTKQDKVTTLLNAIPKQHQILINRYNYKKVDKSITFADACTWADAIKRLEEFKEYSAWHYMNVSRLHNEIKVNDCEQNCLPQAVLKHQETLALTQKLPNWQRAQALFFLGHWLGDIHQPLHISFSDDLGGNKIEFSHFDTKCGNLHRYWDECILYRGKQSRTKWLDLLNAKWDQSSQPKWQTKQVWQWADESFQLTRKPSFNYCHLNNQGSCQKPKDKIKLPSDYLTRYQLVMTQRLLQAAQRLTKVLEVSL